MREDRALLNKYMLLMGVGHGNAGAPARVIQLFPGVRAYTPPVPNLNEK